MLESLVRFSVRRRGVVLVIALVVAGLSAAALKQLSIDAVPDVTNVQVSILTKSPGLSPSEVEQYITYPIESAMNGLPKVTEIRSISRTAISAVTVVFKDEVSVWFARQLVAERLKQAEAEIPPEYGIPELAPVSTALGDIFEFYVESTDGKTSAMDLRTMVDWTVAYKLRSVPGVIEVNAMGGEAKQYQVVVNPKRLAEYRITLGTIYDVLRKNNANIGGGYIEKNGEAYVIRGEAQYRDPSDIGKTVVTTDPDGTPVLLRQIATIKLGAALRFGVVTRQAKGEIVSGTVMMLIGQNSREVVANVKARLAEIQKELPQGVKIHSFYDRAEFIDRVLHTVSVNLIEGAVLVVLVLGITLGTLRGSFIAALAIPLAMGVAVLGMVQLEVIGNMMSLGAIDFGLLVDGAIVMLESSMAALALKQAAHALPGGGTPTPVDVPAVVADSMSQSARAVAFSVGIILLVYLPLMSLTGVEGRMFRPMAITVAMALGGALLFSLTVFPALSAYFLRPPKPRTKAGIWEKLQDGYGRLVDRLSARGGLVAAGVVLLLVITGALASTLGAEFVPRLEEGELSLDVKRLPSISISEAKRLGNQVEEVLLRFPEVEGVLTMTGRGEVATEPVGFDETEVMVKLKEKEHWKSAHDLDHLGELIKSSVEAEVPATFLSVSQPIEDRVNQLISGSRADVAVKVFGPDLPTAKGLADRIGEVMRQIQGTGDLRVQRVLGLPLLDVKADRLRLSRYGIPADEILATVEASRVGRNVGKVFEGPRRFDLTLLLPPAALTPESFGELLVGTQSGQLVPLAQVADIREVEAPASIFREALERRVMVEVNIRGRDLVSYVNEAKERVGAAIQLPAGYRLVWGGQFENFNRAKDRLALVVPAALGIIFGMLFLLFGDARYALAVFGCVPLGLVGGILALKIRGLPFSIPAAVGFIALCGVAVLNGVVMASDLKRHLAEGHDFHESLRHGVRAALRPIVTTALVAAIGFLPMALSTRAGAEVQRPLATVVIGGILSATGLTLIVLPLLLRRLLHGAAAPAPAPHRPTGPSSAAAAVDDPTGPAPPIV